ncbi:hypothetical protein BT96DRAFT_578595 [Gymnopus androsaceus JB14]|uniref:Uncharacterized protein n=1 Tax=Gymnopus androsaceus JB14 TaxID=1447944 RepID=A0A6A4GIV3_9AGAR|nr:hypothetical protein BT96DRAFT_578595 [Gymnopus androsaceus JB14]
MRPLLLFQSSLAAVNSTNSKQLSEKATKKRNACVQLQETRQRKRRITPLPPSQRSKNTDRPTKLSLSPSTTQTAVLVIAKHVLLQLNGKVGLQLSITGIQVRADSRMQASFQSKRLSEGLEDWLIKIKYIYGLSR